ncbi:MAG TPA: DUF1552 domain-containing protein [Nannocystis sp.]
MTFAIRKPPLSRRTVLRGAIGGAAVALAVPPLEAMFGGAGARAADPEGEPIFGLFYWANGVPWHAAHGSDQGANSPGGDVWTPPTQGPDYVPSPLLMPLAAHKVSVATGLEPKTEIPDNPPGQSDGHMRGFMVALTGDRIRPEGFDHPSHTLTCLRPTIDQYIAGHEQFYGNAPPRFRYLCLGVSEARFHDYGHWNAISHSGPDSPIAAIHSPAQLYSLLFDVPADLQALARRVTLIDAVLDDAEGLRARLGGTDRQRLEAHLDHLREVQRRLELSSGTCDAAPAPPGDSGDLIARTDIMAELLAVALNCGLTRVFSFMLTSPATTHVFDNLGVPNGMHQVCHDGKWEFVRAITEYQMLAFARLLDRLVDPEIALDPMGNTVLDRALVYGVSEYGEGYKHSVAEMPVVLAGGACGKLVRGYHYREPGGNLCKVHVTILRALGIDCPSYGFSGAETSEHLTGILA